MKQYLAIFLFMPALAISAELKPFEFELQDSTAPAVCEFSGLNLPDNLKVYAAGAYTGRTLDFQIDDSGHAATQFDIAVNSPDNPVALMLGAYEPTIWNIGWSEGTEIVAVLASGYHRQAVSGVSSGTPIITSTQQADGACGYFYVGNSENRGLNPLSRRLFNQSVDMVFPGDRKGKIIVGEPVTDTTRLVTSAESSPDSFRDNNKPLAGKAGLEQAVERGILRPATTEDAESWLAARALKLPPTRDVPPIAGGGVPKRKLPTMINAYVVLKEFTYPAGLFGGNLATFFIPSGVPMPTGNRGHSTIYVFESGQCLGTLCGTN